MYGRFIKRQLLLLCRIVAAIVYVFPFILYPKRREIWANKDGEEKKWYHWYADTYETRFGSDENNYLNSTYGVYELVKKRDLDGNWTADYDTFHSFSKFRKWRLAYRWLVFRNGSWNWIIEHAPVPGPWSNKVCKVDTGDAGCTTWRNKKHHGKQSVTWTMEGENHFRYSWTKKIIGNYYLNFMAGTSTNRYLLKLRPFNIKNL